MEQQFILRLHETIKHVIDLNEATIDIIDGRTVTLTYKNKKYPGIIVKLPCIVESQKTVDDKQYYKVSDISTLIVIYPDGDFDFETEKEMHELSGLSAPLKYVKSRRFRKRNSKVEYVEEIEKKVNELLEKDLRARSVEIMARDEKDLSDELDVLAAEIENKLAENVGTSLDKGTITIEHEIEDASKPMEELEKIERPRDGEIDSLEKNIEEKRKQMENALNPILQKRFESQLNALVKELEDLKKDRDLK